ncbi:MAG: hypothetical protein LBP22_11450 [Deltaproteobacteria bacterium]|nr:hypothetical protein [Deltaproteobacteria bacterium]
MNFSEDGSPAVWEESVPKEPIKAGSGKKTKNKNLDQAAKDKIIETALEHWKLGLIDDDVATELKLENRQELYRKYFNTPELKKEAKDARAEGRARKKAEAMAAKAEAKTKSKFEAETRVLKDEDLNSLNEIPAQAQYEAEPGSGDDAAENKTTDE